MSLRILEPGLCTLVVDFGRPGSRSLGVPVGGAADRMALALGNALVGNPPAFAALEISMAGPTVQADTPLACVLFGAPFDLSSDRSKASGTCRFVTGTTFTLEPDEVLRIGGTARGMRSYFCVRGGLQGPLILGSRSGLEPLRAGATLGCLPGKIGGRFIRQPDLAGDNYPITLRALNGPQASWFPVGALFGSSPRTVSTASNRMGLRLVGEPLPVPPRELVSEPVCPGSVQVTRDGQCIILGVDGQTIGGYPKIAQIIRADLDLLGQLRPGEQIRFEQVTLAEAEDAAHARVRQVNEWLTRLAVAEVFGSRS